MSGLQFLLVIVGAGELGEGVEMVIPVKGWEVEGEAPAH